MRKNTKSDLSVGLGQVYRAQEDAEVSVVVVYKAPASGGSRGVLPKDERVILENSPPRGATGVYALPLSYGKLESHFVPESDLQSPKYEGYGLGITLVDLKRYFVLEPDAEVRFDDPRAEAHWAMVKRHSLGSEKAAE